MQYTKDQIQLAAMHIGKATQWGEGIHSLVDVVSVLVWRVMSNKFCCITKQQLNTILIYFNNSMEL
jgi:hypothetical protein